MRIEVIRTLDIQRELYTRPRDMSRFGWYLRQLTGDEDAGGDRDVVLPIISVNPMGKSHCLAAVEALIRLDAEAVLAEAARETEARLRSVDGEAKVALNLLDDVGGGWTDRHFSEALLRFGSERSDRASRKRRFVVVPCWSSETYTRVVIHAETLAAIFRFVWREKAGAPRTLKGQLRAESLALAFAGATAPSTLAPLLTPAELERAKEVIAAHEDAGDFPTQFACWFGDEAAAAAGYPQLGLPHRAGFAVALSLATTLREPPEAALPAPARSR
ncbi:MAG TPA: hypothetical protein VNN21_08665 [Dehalococcoidia bacterium]|nr:hypothetical protein [Dehalococcoidia bacterium]